MNFKATSFFIILALAVSACEKPAQSTVVLPEGVGIYEPQDVPLIEKGRLSKADRIHSTVALFKALEDNYALWPFKQQTNGVDPENIAKKCIDREAIISEKSYRSDFIDRLTNCIAALKDTHLNLKAGIRRSMVLGLIGEIAEVDGKVYIASARKDLISNAIHTNQKLQGIQNALVPGAEVISIDNVPALQAIKDFQKYLSASTERAAHKEAMLSFFLRSVAYPKNKNLKLEVSVNGTVQQLEVPWYYSSNVDLETDVLLGERKLKDLRADGLSASLSGFYSGDAVYTDSELSQQNKFYVDENLEQEFINFGFLKSNPKKCYMKVSTFDLINKKTYDSSKLPLDASMVLEQLLMRCEAADAELILDLYFNEGGDLEVAKTLLSALLPEDVDAKILRSFRIAKNIWEVTNIYRTWSQEDESYLQQYEALRKGFIGNQPTTDWMVRDVGTEISGIFPNKVTAIVSPYCVSACDAVVAGLKRTKRATLIGEPSNGTGAGFLSLNKTSYTYTDANNLFRIAIPNQLFSVIVKQTDEAILPFNANDIIEGRPMAVDVPYSLTLKDITENFADLKVKLGK